MFGPILLTANAVRKAISMTHQEIQDEATVRATNCSQLLAIKKEYGHEINPDKICVIVCDMHLQTFIAVREIEDYDFCYSAVEQSLCDLIQSGLSDRLMAYNLGLLLDQSEILFNPRQSDQRTIDFCYCINRISYYARRLERDLQNCDLETLKSLDQLRIKVKCYLSIGLLMNSPLCRF